MLEQAKSDATVGWDASPITTARMCAEVYAQIKDEDWSMVGASCAMRLHSFELARHSIAESMGHTVCMATMVIVGRSPPTDGNAELLGDGSIWIAIRLHASSMKSE